MLLTLSALTAFHGINQVGMRWNRFNGEQPLLALLAGLGAGTRIKRHVLRATLMPLLLIEGTLMGLGLAVVAVAHASTWIDVPVVATQLLCVGWIAAVLPGIFAGREGTTLFRNAFGGWILLLILATTGLVMTGAPGAATVGATLGVGAVVGFSVLYLPPLFALLLRGHENWRAFRHCPHPFLAGRAR